MRDVAILGQRAVGALEAKTNSPLSCNIQKFASKGQYYKFRPLDAARGGVPSLVQAAWPLSLQPAHPSAGQGDQDFWLQL